MCVAHLVRALWQDEGIIKAYDNKSKFQLNDSADYYFNDIDRLMYACEPVCVNVARRGRLSCLQGFVVECAESVDWSV